MRKTHNDEFEKQKKLDQMGVTSAANPAQNRRTSEAALAKQMGIQRSATQGQPAQNRSFSRLAGAQQGSMQNQVQKQPLIGKPIQAGSPVQTGAAPNSQWQQKMDGVIDKIMNREDFKYDLNGDAFYQQYKDQYTQQGKMAMMDTMGQAAALTGGYGSSYAQNVGQQAYQGYLQNLNDKIPELYQLALDTYQREGDNLYQQYSMLSDRDNQEYSRYQDQRDFDYQKGRDAVSDSQWQQTFDYGKDRDAVADSQWERNFAASEDQRAIDNDHWQQDYDRSVYESDRDYDYRLGRDQVEDSQWEQQFAANEEQRGIDNDFRQQQYDRDVYEDDRNFGYQQQRDAVGDQQWQQTFDRGVYENDRDYNRSVYEDDRNYDRSVYESDRAYDRDVFESDRSYDYQVGRDKVADAQWRESFDYGKERDAVGDQQWQKQFDADEEQRGIDNDYREKVYGLDYQKYLADLDETENGGGVSGIYAPPMDVDDEEIAQDYKTAVKVGSIVQPYKDVPAATKSGSEALKHFNNAVSSRSGATPTRGMKPQTGGDDQTAMPQAKESDAARKYASTLMTKDQAAKRGMSGDNYKAWLYAQINHSNLSEGEALWVWEHYGFTPQELP